MIINKILVVKKMEGYDCKKLCKGNCIVEVLISIIIGVLVGIAFSNGLIASVFNFTVGALITAAISSIILIIAIFAGNIICKFNSFEKCICSNGICIAFAIVGTVVSGLLVLSMDLSITAILSILSVAFTAFFLGWLLLSMFSLAVCLIRSSCNK